MSISEYSGFLGFYQTKTTILFSRENLQFATMNWFFRTESKNKEKKSKLKTFDEFVKYLSSPWRIVWINFIAGIFRGLGILIGMTVVVAILIWMITKMVDFPLIGEYFLDLKNMLENFSPNGNFR